MASFRITTEHPERHFPHAQAVEPKNGQDRPDLDADRKGVRRIARVDPE